MISRAPAISATTPSPGYRPSSTVGKIAKQGPLGLRVREQLRDAPPQLQGYVAGVVAFLRADPTAASAAFTVVGGAEYKTAIFSLAGGHGFLDYQVFDEQRVVVLADLIWLE